MERTAWRETLPLSAPKGKDPAAHRVSHRLSGHPGSAEWHLSISTEHGVPGPYRALLCQAHQLLEQGFSKYQHHLGTCQKCRFLGPILKSETLQMGPRNLYFNKPSRRLRCILKNWEPLCEKGARSASVHGYSAPAAPSLAGIARVSCMLPSPASPKSRWACK